MSPSSQEQPRWLLRGLSRALGQHPQVEPVAPDAQRLQCMEVWGGNRAAASRLEMWGLDAWIFCQPHESPEGGDLHYVSSCGGGEISRFVVADVAGHGQVASELARRLRSLVGKHLNELNNARLAIALNREFARLESTGRFATAILATFFGPSSHLLVCNAGHPRPLWHHARTGQWRLLEPAVPGHVASLGAAANLPLGVIEPTDYEQFAVELELGDTVLLYTDSLIEAQAPQTGRELGESGLLELATRLGPLAEPSFAPGHEGSAPRLGARLLEAVAAYRGQAPAQDDQTLVVLRHNAAPRAAVGPAFQALARWSRALGLTDH